MYFCCERQGAGFSLNGKIRKAGIIQTNVSAGCSPVLILLIIEIFRRIRIGMETKI